MGSQGRGRPAAPKITHYKEHNDLISYEPNMTQAKTLTPAEIERALAYVAQRGFALRNRVMLLTGLWSGMRVGEIASLRVGDVRNGDGTIRAEVRLTPEQTKGQHARTVFLPEKLRTESVCPSNPVS